MAMRIQLLLFGLLPRIVFSAITNEFINPPPSGEAADYSTNLIWPLDSTQTIQWTSTYETYELWIYQDNGNGNGSPTSLVNGTSSGSGQRETTFTWDVQTTLNFVSFPAFWFILYDGSDNENRFNSHYFNITSPTSALTSSTSSTTSTLTSSSFATSATSAQTLTSATSSSTSSPTNSPSPTSQASLGTGGKIGIGIGVPIVAIASSVAIFLLWRRSRRYKTNAPETSMLQYQPPEGAATLPSAYGSHISGYGKHELSGNETQRYELDERRDHAPRHELGDYR